MFGAFPITRKSVPSLFREETLSDQAFCTLHNENYHFVVCFFLYPRYTCIPYKLIRRRFAHPLRTSPVLSQLEHQSVRNEVIHYFPKLLS